MQATWIRPGHRRNHAGVNVVSTPVFALHERIVGCLILIGTFTEKMIEEYGPKTVSIAKQISQKLGAKADTLYPV